MNAQDFHFVMIKPTHYDDDGYPIQWLRSAIPSNTLASLNGLAEAARERSALGDNVQIHLHTYDETNKRVRPNKIARDIRRKGGKALIALVGVQSNQFPRATDLAREFMREGLPTAIGGFMFQAAFRCWMRCPRRWRRCRERAFAILQARQRSGGLIRFSGTPLMMT